MTTRRGTLHIGLWISAVPVALAAARVLMFSRGDTTVLRVLLENLQIVPVLVGTALLIFPAVVVLFLLVLITSNAMREMAARWFASRPIALVCVCVVILLVVLTARIDFAIAISLQTAVVIFALLVSRRENSWARPFSRFFRAPDRRNPRILIAAVVLLVVVQGFTDPSSFWVPLESVTQSGGEPTRAWVMSVTSEWTTLLTEDRMVLRMPSDSIVERVVCDQGATTLLQRLTPEQVDAVPQCVG